tara:strand:- start:8 stop:640 length:633 start_codon:yes stop_codon:yes gene_type:complete
MNKLEAEKYKSFGVKIIDPITTYIDSSVKFNGNDIIINPNTHLKGDTEIYSNCTIGPDSYLIDSIINDNTNINFSFVENSTIESKCEIGPYSRIRKNSIIGRNVKIGNFAEIKNSNIGDNTNINHFCYIGDSLIGLNVNVGAGVVTCNYNGEKKSQTVIGNECFIGSGTMIIAPRNIGNNVVTGAGSIITKDIDDNLTVVGNPAKILDNS